MHFDIQKANMWKRISAAMLDLILLVVLATGVGAIMTSLTGLDGYNDTLQVRYDYYEAEYGIDLDMTQEDWDAMSQEEQKQYEEIFQMLLEDEQANHAYGMIISLTIMCTSLSLLVAFLVLELAVPLWLKNGQTVGKKVFGLAVMRTDGVKVTPFMMVVRSVLGKYTIETMIPVLVILMLFFGIGMTIAPLLVMALLIAQVLMLSMSRNRTVIHDFLSHTVVVDMSSQMIFDSDEALLAYKQRLHAEDVAQQDD